MASLSYPLPIIHAEEEIGSILKDAKATIRRRNRESERDSRLKKPHKEQQDREISNNFLRTRSPEGGQDYPSPGAYGPLQPHRITDTLSECRLRSTHYTISQDHTSGQEAHEHSLLASFGKRRRTDKPSIPLGGSRLLQCSPNLLPSLANGNDVVAQNGGSGMQEISKDDLDFLNNWRPVVSKIPEDAVSFPQETATPKPNEGKDKGDEVEFEWFQGRSRRVQSIARQHSLRRQDRGTSLVDKGGDRPPAKSS
ncbi:hypothetical protein NW765_016512 [Fusarium oxysporum]|nr:hypothetical protein NW765_016512 [Fusarium oxysporum]KAJ4273445.1 hypothetical protein NW764_011990 [Fusarium oxysporum]